MKYYVTIEETVSEQFEIIADSMEGAISIAQEKYYNEEIVLEPGNLISKQISASNEDFTQNTEWTEF